MSKKGLVLAVTVLLTAGIGSYVLLTRSTPKAQKEETKPVVTTLTATPSATLKIEDLEKGSGREVKSGDAVVMHYSGTLENGEKFDSSYDRGQPFTTRIGVGQVIKGWDEGVPGMKIGGKRRLTIPPDLAYGNRGAGNKIPPNSTLIFDVELIDIK